jgi:hypothetical protein
MPTTAIMDMMKHGSSQPKVDRNPWRVCACGRDYNRADRKTLDPTRCNGCVERQQAQQLAAIRQAGRA